MQKPLPTDYLIGNRVSLVLICAFSALILFLWWTVPGVTDWAPFVALIGTTMAVVARQKIAAYTEWKQAWDGLGDDPGPNPRLRKARWLLLAVSVWVVLGFVMLSLDYNEPVNMLLLVAFVVVTLVLLTRYLRSGRAPARPKVRPVAVVSVLLPVPRHSPSIQQTLQALPAYCAGLG